MIDYIEKAKAFAMMAHKGQTDKAGKDYFTAHVAVVADGVEPDPLVKASAYLHDTVEDTGTTIDTIRAEFPQEVAEAVSVLTRKKDMTYAEYIWRVKQNDIAVKVKRADLVSNMDLNRIPYPRNALILDASTRREQVLSRGNAILETCKDSRLCCCCFWLLSESAVSALIRTRRIRQASEQDATRSDVNCL